MTTAPPVLGLKGARLAFGDKLLFDGLDIFMGRGDRFCLVGLNGTGKSTLMRCLTAELELDAGERTVQPGLRIAHLPQEVEVPEGQTVRDFVIGGGAGEAPVAAFEAEAALARIGLDPAFKGGRLSGGETRRAALARALAQSPDVLLLDEPTNHLDLAAIRWLEGQLKGFPGAVLAISHDRRFLEAISTATLWLQRRSLLRMDGPFSRFDAWSEEVLELEIKAAKKLSKVIDRETRWLRRGVTARRRRNQGRLRKLEGLRAARRERTVGRTKLSMTAEEGPPASQLVVDVYGISKGFKGEDGTTRPIVSDFTTRILKRDRVGILGPNGAGKTTLLRLLVGELEPDSGRVKRGRRTEAAYFDQARAGIDPAITPWRFLAPQGGDHVNVRGHLRHVVGYLKDFLFDEDDARALIGTLSGGQRNRLMLAKVLAKPSNLLVLDEPTNDLDMDTLDMLQDTLDAYDGTLLVVSHDRDFLDKLVTSLIVLEGDGRAEEYVGGYDDYLRQRGTRPLRKAKPARPTRARPRPAATPRKLSYKDQRALDSLPGEIAALEDKIAALGARLDDPELFSRDAGAFTAAARRLEEAREELADREERWLTLAALKESLAGGGS